MTRAEREQGKTNRFHSYYDYSLLFLTLFLISFGLVMIYSTSSYNAGRDFSDPTFYLKKQGAFACMGIVIMLIVSKIDYRFYIRKLQKKHESAEFFFRS